MDDLKVLQKTWLSGILPTTLSQFAEPGALRMQLNPKFDEGSMPHLDSPAGEAMNWILQALTGADPKSRYKMAMDGFGQLAGGLIETICALDGQVLRLADHLARLDRSARELYGFGVPERTADRVRAVADGVSGRCAVRVVLAPDASVDVTAAPAGLRPSSTRVDAVTRTGVWRHKWADRSWIEVGERAYRGPLYVAPDG